MRFIGIAGMAAVMVVALAGVASAQFPGEPKAPAAYDAVADMRYTFARGAPNDTVRAAQRALADLGYYRGSLDGIVGPELRRAVWEYQKAHEFPVTGSLDPQTVTALGVGPTEVAETPESFAAASPGGEPPSPVQDMQAP
jgi:peptidoglycan hydrolase-like protein with peptidoglycan-binding domain